MNLEVDHILELNLFVSVEDLPAPIADGLDFFRAALDRQVISVPGIFFDVNPGRRRSARLSRFHQRVRLSFGPSLEEVGRGMDRIAAMIEEARTGQLAAAAT